MSLKGAPNRGRIVNAIVLVLSYSDMGKAFDRPQIKKTLQELFSEYCSKKILSLQEVWRILSEDSQFGENDADSAFCLLKIWQSELGIEVDLPTHLSDLTPAKIKLQSTQCIVPGFLKTKAFNVPNQPRKKQSTMTRLRRATQEVKIKGEELSAKVSKKASASVSSVQIKPNTVTAKILVVMLGAITVGALVFVGYQVVNVFRGPNTQHVALDTIGGKLPIQSASRLGKDLFVVIADAQWFRFSEEERKGVVADALEQAKAQGIEILIIKDSLGKMRVSAQWIGAPPEPYLVFY